MNMQSLYERALNHKIKHGCSAYPYENGTELVEAIQKFNPKSIIEIGTGIGYTATLIALAAPNANIITIEKNDEHGNEAKAFFIDNAVVNQITLISEPAELYLPKRKELCDFIFFDGFQIHYQFIFEYERLLRRGGILFLGNNHLQSRTSDMFFNDLQNQNYWKIIDRFGETTVAERV